MSTLMGRNIAGATGITTASSLSYDPSVILGLAEKTISLDTMYLFGLPMSEALQLVSGMALLIYILTSIFKALKGPIKAIFNFICSFFK